jgi:hypothetical protein
MRHDAALHFFVQALSRGKKGVWCSKTLYQLEGKTAFATARSTC